MPLFVVREVHATGAQIGTITMTMTVVMLFGYYVWPRISRSKGGRFVLLATTLGMVLYPALSAATPYINLIILYAGIADFFQGGLDLVFFDELMKTVPAEYSATFVSLAQSMQYLSMIVAPLIGTWIATYIGLGGALLLSAGLRANNWPAWLAIWERPLQITGLVYSFAIGVMTLVLGPSLLAWTVRAMLGLPFRELVELPNVQMVVSVLSLLGLLYIAAVMTLWSMVLYLRAAWPSLMSGWEQRGGR